MHPSSSRAPQSHLHASIAQADHRLDGLPRRNTPPCELSCTRCRLLRRLRLAHRLLRRMAVRRVTPLHR
eukprot:2991153-Pyramimonas_sp.AAC.1